jgi:hypothetical protein
VTIAVDANLETLVVVVPADITLGHRVPVSNNRAFQSTAIESRGLSASRHYSSRSTTDQSRRKSAASSVELRMGHDAQRNLMR